MQWPRACGPVARVPRARGGGDGEGVARRRRGDGEAAALLRRCPRWVAGVGVREGRAGREEAVLMVERAGELLGHVFLCEISGDI